MCIIAKNDTTGVNNLFHIWIVNVILLLVYCQLPCAITSWEIFVLSLVGRHGFTHLLVITIQNNLSETVDIIICLCKFGMLALWDMIWWPMFVMTLKKKKVHPMHLSSLINAFHTCVVATFNVIPYFGSSLGIVIFYVYTMCKILSIWGWPIKTSPFIRFVMIFHINTINENWIIWLSKYIFEK